MMCRFEEIASLELQTLAFGRHSWFRRYCQFCAMLTDEVLRVNTHWILALICRLVRMHFHGVTESPGAVRFRKPEEAQGPSA